MFWILEIHKYLYTVYLFFLTVPNNSLVYVPTLRPDVDSGVRQAAGTDYGPLLKLVGDAC